MSNLRIWKVSHGPDVIDWESFVKYKHLGHTDMARDDIHQIISYLHVLEAKSAYLAHPADSIDTSYIKSIGSFGISSYASYIHRHDRKSRKEHNAY